MSNSLGAKSAKVEKGDDQGEMEPLRGESCVKRSRDRLLKEARNSGPVYGSGRVAHLVHAFERLLSITRTEYSDLKDENGSKENKNERMKWALPGLQQPKVPEALQASSFDLLLRLDSQLSSSWITAACFWVKSDISTLVAR